MATALNGIIHGRSIELEHESGLPDGQKVSVEIEAILVKRIVANAQVPSWIGRFEVNAAVRPGKFVVRGTRLLADDLARKFEEGWTEEKLLQTHSELTPADVAAVREYTKVPLEMRRCFGAWANDAEELDDYLEWNRQRRKVGRRSVEE
jgi:uncharacterized protein (DUF433 family)